MLIHDSGYHFGTYHNTRIWDVTRYKKHMTIFIKPFEYSDVMSLCPNLQSTPLQQQVRSDVHASLEQCMTHISLRLVSKLILQVMSTLWH